MIHTHRFFAQLVQLKVRKNSNEVPNLCGFLTSQSTESAYIGVKRLAMAVNEFLRNEYLKSFGTRKNKLEESF